MRVRGRAATARRRRRSTGKADTGPRFHKTRGSTMRSAPRAGEPGDRFVPNRAHETARDTLVAAVARRRSLPS
jgi:hypothetical protein